MTDSPKSGAAPEDPLAVWYLHREYTVAQAALLIAGHDPSQFEDVEQLSWEERPKDYEAVKTALVKHMESSFSFGNEVQLDRKHGGGIDVRRSTVSFDSVQDWLTDRGRTAGFFSRREEAPRAALPDYLNRNHPRFAPKLAAAVRAWEAVDETLASRSGRSPRGLLMDWLEEHGGQFDLTLDGKPNRTGIEQVASVANWQPQGGAPRTPKKS